jgi:hypothetical protein
MVLGRGFLYCVSDAKNIVHIIQRRQHGLDGTGGKKTLLYLVSLTSTFKKIASRDEYFFKDLPPLHENYINS